MAVKRPFTREQRMTIVHGILCFVLILVVLQLWLFTATMNAFLGGDESVIWPAAAASIACLLLNAGLLWYLYTLEGRPGAAACRWRGPRNARNPRCPSYGRRGFCSGEGEIRRREVVIFDVARGVWRTFSGVLSGVFQDRKTSTGACIMSALVNGWKVER
jgi:hypothetical protein